MGRKPKASTELIHDKNLRPECDHLSKIVISLLSNDDSDTSIYHFSCEHELAVLLAKRTISSSETRNFSDFRTRKYVLFKSLTVINFILELTFLAESQEKEMDTVKSSLPD